MTRALGDITAEVKRDHDHEVGLAIYLTDRGKGWAYAGILPSTGAVLAWDGRYFFTAGDSYVPEQRHSGDLGDLAEWNDRDTSASQIMSEQNGLWLPVLHTLLWPSWSLTALTDRLLKTRLAEGREGLATHAQHPVAYFPTDTQAPDLDR